MQRSYISNPCFDFWLLLHFKNFAENCDLKDLLINKKVDGVCCSESTLKKFLPEYTKKNFDFEKLQDKIDIAIETAKLYATELDDIKSNLGTNFHKLLLEIKK